jgi:hypothetical protein
VSCAYIPRSGLHPESVFVFCVAQIVRVLKGLDDAGVRFSGVKSTTQ